MSYSQILYQGSKKISALSKIVHIFLKFTSRRKKRSVPAGLWWFLCEKPAVPSGCLIDDSWSAAHFPRTFNSQLDVFPSLPRAASGPPPPAQLPSWVIAGHHLPLPRLTCYWREINFDSCQSLPTFQSPCPQAPHHSLKERGVPEVSWGHYTQLGP